MNVGLLNCNINGRMVRHIEEINLGDSEAQNVASPHRLFAQGSVHGGVDSKVNAAQMAQGCGDEGVDKSAVAFFEASRKPPSSSSMR